MTRPSPREGLLLAFAVILAAGCRVPGTPLDPRAVCADEVCVRLKEVSAAEWTVIADVQAPAATFLRNAVARDASTTGAPCQAEVPVAAVVFDGVVVHAGPISIAGAHRLELQFPAAPTSSVDRPVLAVLERFVELDLSVNGRARCLRVPVLPKKDAP